ncbi:hypothetical protein R3W88_022849 [Solanum pinnatisectum]|uniref:AT-hook motif nuclear-localized protein n=1 Tax=Solanum pinnatisectum TaxID=50273 RepID=A0AAV9LVX8_9SOLN|nr:hypothetical protein R3W88_022849 [Solanum pinnatisectum]
MIPANIIFHQPQQQKKIGRPKPSEKFLNHEESSAGGDFTVVSSSKIPAKKPFGRPLCFGNKWTWHLISVHIGEDIVGKLITFLQQGPRPRAVCIISATGVVCSVKLREYVSQYDSISLSGSLLLPDNNDRLEITGGLSVLLSRPDGSNICGIIAKMLKTSFLVEHLQLVDFPGLSRQLTANLNRQNLGTG